MWKRGAKSKSGSNIGPLPDRQVIPVPRPDLSAREAYDLVKPFAVQLSTAEWFLALAVSLNMSGAHDGRIADGGAGSWRFAFGDPRGANYVSATLFFNGSLSFKAGADRSARAAGAGILPVADDWLDSSSIAEIIAREPLPDGAVGDYGLEMRLMTDPEQPPTWRVSRRRSRPDQDANEWEHYLHVVAATGEIAFETFERSLRKDWRTVEKLESRLRLRSEKGDWMNESEAARRAGVRTVPYARYPLLLVRVLHQVVDHARIGQRRGVAEV